MISNKILGCAGILMAGIITGMYFLGMISLDVVEIFLWAALILISIPVLVLLGKKFWQELRG